MLNLVIKLKEWKYPMNAYEKCVLLKETIRKLYVDEGRSISYIHRLLEIDRHTISKLIKEWNFIQINQDKGKIKDFLAQYKEFIIARIKDGWTNKEIHTACKVGHAFLNKVIEYDKDIKEAKQMTTCKDKEICEYIDGEVWKQILGYPNYEVSNKGRIRNNLGMLKQHTNIKNGYKYVRLVNPEGKSKGLRVHILIAHAYCEGYSKERCTVNHKNGNKIDNRAENLEWLSQSENNKHSYDVLNRPVSKVRRKGYKIVYKNKYTFKTVTAFARFAEISETQAQRWVWENPEKHDIVLL